MADTLITYEGDGSTTTYTVPFDYLRQSFVRVSKNDEVLTGGSYGDTSVDYYFLDDRTIKLKVAPASGEILEIRRYTSATDRVVSFSDASILKATDLNSSQVQILHIAEEAREILEGDGFVLDSSGAFNGKGHIVTNVADPEGATDVVTLGYYMKDKEGVYQARVEAEKIIKDGRDEITAHTDAQVQRVTDEGDTQVERIAKITDNALLSTYHSAFETHWTVTEDLPEDSVITIPEEGRYVVGRYHVKVSWNGLELIRGVNFDEEGEESTVSTKLKFLMPLTEGDEVSVWVIPLLNYTV